MSEIHQAPSTAPKPKSRRRNWVHNRQAQAAAKKKTQQPEIVAAEPKTVPEIQVQTISEMPPQVSGVAPRRASVQAIPSSLIITPPTASVEWNSTQSCPSPAVGDIYGPTASQVAVPDTMRAAPQVHTPETVRAALQITPRTTFDPDPVAYNRRAATSISTVSSTIEHQTFSTLAEHKFFIPPTASLNTSSLILFKTNTPSLERFRLLHNQLFIELGRVVEEQLQPPLSPETNTEAYRQREELMLGLLTDVVPALNHFTESVGKEVKVSIQKNRAGLRLWVGEREEKDKDGK